MGRRLCPRCIPQCWSPNMNTQSELTRVLVERLAAALLQALKR